MEVFKFKTISMTLSELATGMTVWHPTLGKGDVTDILEKCVVEVKFNNNNYKYYSKWYDKEYPFDISHLYPHPVTVIATQEVEAYKALADSYTEVWKECLQGKLILYHELVKAQGELIDLLESGYLSNQRARDLRDLKVKINQLQSKKEK